ncbi:hypothetical protein ACLOJK_039605 [Asimina triloba]
MRNDGQKSQGGLPRSSSMPGRSNGFFPSSRRAISSYLRIVSSGTMSIASTLRSAGASVASSIAERVDDACRDQVQWACFDKLEAEVGVIRQVLLLAYRSGFQVWDVEEADDVHELVSRYDGAVSFMQVQQRPSTSDIPEDKFAGVRPLLVVVGDGAPGGGDIQDGQESPLNGSNNGCHEMGNRNFVPTVVRFYSVRSHSYVHVLKFRTAVFSVRCSPRVVIHCFNAATLEREYTILTHPIVSGSLGSGKIGYGPLAVGPRWLAYAGNPISVSTNARVSPQHLTSITSLPTFPSNGSLVAHYAVESSKQIAAGIVTLGDMGYKKLSRYCSELLPDGKGSTRTGNLSAKINGTDNGHWPEAENIGMVIVRDIVSKLVVSQFRAHTSPILALCFNPSGTLLVTASVQGHNINVFGIMPSPLGSSSGFDTTKSHVHLYRLQRGLTNAVIQDISFSDDSQWIMISSSRGTGHLFSISPSGGEINLQSDDHSFINGNHGLGSATKQAVRWPPCEGSAKTDQYCLCASGPPVTLSVVSRIRNGNNGWRGTVSVATAVATGRASSISGAIASAFHNCKGKILHAQTSSSSPMHHLLVFSPSGSVIQYMLRLSTGSDSINDVSGLAIAHYGSAPDADVRLVVDALQKWDITQRQSRREREDNVDFYGERGNSDNGKLCPRTRKGTSVHPTDNGLVRDANQVVEDKHHMYLSEAELQMHPAYVPLWIKSQVMLTDGLDEDSDETLAGEIEIERIPTRLIEARSKDLIPVFNHLQSPTFQQPRCIELCFLALFLRAVSKYYYLNYKVWTCALDSHQNGPMLLRQKSGLSQDSQLSRRSSCCSLDGMSEGAMAVAELHNGIEENGWGGLQMLTEGFVNNNGSPTMNTQLEFVNSRERLKMEGLLQFVNNKECPNIESHFEDDKESDEEGIEWHVNPGYCDVGTTFVATLALLLGGHALASSMLRSEGRPKWSIWLLYWAGINRGSEHCWHRKLAIAIAFSRLEYALFCVLGSLVTIYQVRLRNLTGLGNLSRVRLRQAGW